MNMKRYCLWLVVLVCFFSFSEAGASEIEITAERPAIFDSIKTAPTNSLDLTPYYSVNRDGDGLGEELPSSIMYFKKGSKEYSTSMAVTDLSLCKRPIETEICQSFIKTIVGKPPLLGTDISNTRIGDAGAVTIFLTPIESVELDGVDIATAFIGISTQDPPRGEIVLLIYARRGTNLIELRTHVRDCAGQVKPNESDLSFYKHCVSKKVIAEASSKAKQLTKLFKLNK
jgi:hypothetical protein